MSIESKAFVKEFCSFSLREGCFILGWLNFFIHCLWFASILSSFVVQEPSKLNTDAQTYKVNVNVFVMFLLISCVTLSIMNLLLLVGTYKKRFFYLEVYVSGYSIFVCYAIIGGLTEILKTKETMTSVMMVNIIGSVALMILAVAFARFYKEELKFPKFESLQITSNSDY